MELRGRFEEGLQLIRRPGRNAALRLGRPLFPIPLDSIWPRRCRTTDPPIHMSGSSREFRRISLLATGYRSALPLTLPLAAQAARLPRLARLAGWIPARDPLFRVSFHVSRQRRPGARGLRREPGAAARAAARSRANPAIQAAVANSAITAPSSGSAASVLVEQHRLKDRIALGRIIIGSPGYGGARRSPPSPARCGPGFSTRSPPFNSATPPTARSRCSAKRCCRGYARFLITADVPNFTSAGVLANLVTSSPFSLACLFVCRRYAQLLAERYASSWRSSKQPPRTLASTFSFTMDSSPSAAVTIGPSSRAATGSETHLQRSSCWDLSGS